MGKPAFVALDNQVENNDQFLNEIQPTAQFFLMNEMLNQTVHAICCFDKTRDYKLIYANSTAEQLWGFKSKEVLGLNLEELSQKHFGPELGVFLKDCTTVLCGFSRKTVETEFKKNWYLRSQIDFLKDENGDSRYLICLTKDITPAKKIEKNLEKANNQIGRMFNAAPGMIFQMEMGADETFSFSFVSDQVADLYGYTPDEVYKKPDFLFSSIHPEDAEGAMNLIKISATLLLPFKWEGRIISKSGETKWIMARSTPEKRENGVTSWDGIIIEITEQKQLETSLEEEKMKLVHSSRLGELGKMAGGIAHEINNPMFAIRLSAENLLNAIKSGNLTTEYVKSVCQTIIDVSDRVTQIVKGLRQFSRDGSQDPMVITSVKQVIDDTLALCQQKFKINGIGLRVPKLDEFLTVECRPVQISQVIINLINNSFDAIKGLPEPWVEISVFEKLDYVVIQVTDSGSGIPPEIADKILQPFYTTKPIGEGTGLGLSISESIVSHHKGKLWIDTECKNTRFCISLPKVQH